MPSSLSRDEREPSLEPISVKLYPDGRMDTRNAALYLGLKEKTLAMMRSEGTGPEFVKRGRVFYFKADLDAWVEQGRATSTAQARQQSITPPAATRRKHRG